MTITGIPSLAWMVRKIAQELSADLGEGLRDRARQELDENLTDSQLRELAVQWVMEEARGVARMKTAAAERAVTERARERQTKELAQATAAFWARAEQAKSDRRKAFEDGSGHEGAGIPGSRPEKDGCRGCQACCDRRTELREQHRAQMIQDCERQIREALFVQWTAEILGCEIAMPDGSRTTWGEARREHHRARHAMLTKNGWSNLESAALHTAALEELDRTGADCLNDLAKIAE